MGLQAQFKDRQPGIVASVLPPGLRDVGLDQKLTEQVPLDLTFRDETGRELPLSTYFGASGTVCSGDPFHMPNCSPFYTGVTAIRIDILNQSTNGTIHGVLEGWFVDIVVLDPA